MSTRAYVSGDFIGVHGYDLFELQFIVILSRITSDIDITDVNNSSEKGKILVRSVLGARAKFVSARVFQLFFRLVSLQSLEADLSSEELGVLRAACKAYPADFQSVRHIFASSHRRSLLKMVYITNDGRVLVGHQKRPKRDEIALIDKSISLLNIDGCLAVANAPHCRAAFADLIHSHGCEYVLAIKANNPDLYYESIRRFARIDDIPTYGRRLQIPNFREDDFTFINAENIDFPGIAALGCLVIRQRDMSENSPAKRFFALSAAFTSERMLEIAAIHRRIEAGSYWIVEIIVDERRLFSPFA
ncbi:hypothetical protein SAMN02745172_04344 [Pseudoxanthobacter soli DSM 19599]|uniref:Uncharacterized protein n=1 Tax=Pseudoxanthobacter soli DSM 19599 TaxID=1123029 RepID=A0A1M7ZRX9_9HYPH|nr:hypothetical protein [Pseudoxanthobacter soli]SHO67663.1 hypothetical protein SAMN02745172_04344 [Pseudoxanthobacter soli DSM 19599]